MENKITHVKNNRLLYLYLTQGGVCHYCKRALWDGERLIACDIDHKLPSSRGGKDDITNVVISCVGCNTQKANMTEEEFFEVSEHIRAGKMSRNDVSNFVTYRILKGQFGHLDTRKLEVVSLSEAEPTLDGTKEAQG